MTAKSNETLDHTAANRSIVRSRAISGAWASVTLTPFTLILSAAASILIARALGPERLAVLTAFAAVSTTLVIFLDFGLTKSVPKIVSAVAIKNGRTAAVNIARTLLLSQMSVFFLGWIVLLAADISGFWDARRNLGLGFSFLLLVGFRVVLASLLGISRGVAAAALHTAFSIRLMAVQALAEPLLTVPLAMATGNPYYVIAGGLLCDLLHALLLRRRAGYDLDETKPQQRVPLLAVLQQHRFYLSLTYLQFLFNRFVIGNALIFWILSALGHNRATIANAGLALSMATQFWNIADLPYSQLQVPLMARLHAAGDNVRFQQVRTLLTGLNVACSCSLCLIVAGIGGQLLLVLYGAQFSLAVEWGVKGATLALVLNLFSIGNRTLFQQDQYRAVVTGLCAAIAAIAASLLTALRITPPAALPFTLVMIVVAGRGVFWLLTDAWADIRSTASDPVKIKTRGAVALVIALLVLLNAPHGSLSTALFSTTVAVFTFFCAFRVLGGVGESNRRVMTGTLPRTLHWCVNCC